MWRPSQIVCLLYQERWKCKRFIWDPRSAFLLFRCNRANTLPPVAIMSFFVLCSSAVTVLLCVLWARFLACRSHLVYNTVSRPHSFSSPGLETVWIWRYQHLQQLPWSSKFWIQTLFRAFWWRFLSLECCHFSLICVRFRFSHLHLTTCHSSAGCDISRLSSSFRIVSSVSSMTADIYRMNNETAGMKFGIPYVAMQQLMRTFRYCNACNLWPPNL